MGCASAYLIVITLFMRSYDAIENGLEQRFFPQIVLCWFA